MWTFVVRMAAVANAAAEALGAVSLIASCVLILLEVVLRGFFSMTTGISVEYSTYFFVFLVFAALARTQSSGAMIYMEIGFDRYPARVRRLLEPFRWTLGLVYGVVAIYYLWEYTARTCHLGQVSMFPSRTPLCAPQSVMVAGMGFLTLEFLIGCIAAWHRLFAGRDAPDGAPATSAGERF